MEEVIWVVIDEYGLVLKQSNYVEALACYKQERLKGNEVTFQLITPEDRHQD